MTSSNSEWRRIAGGSTATFNVPIPSDPSFAGFTLSTRACNRYYDLGVRVPLIVARALGLAESAVSIKFGTTERLGFEGREEGMSATAVAMVIEAPNSSENA